MEWKKWVGSFSDINSVPYHCLELLENFENQKKINKEDLLTEMTICLNDIENDFWDSNGILV